VQRKEKSRLKLGPQPLLQRLLDAVRQLLMYFHKVGGGAQQRGCLRMHTAVGPLNESLLYLQHLHNQVCCYNRPSGATGVMSRFPTRYCYSNLCISTLLPQGVTRDLSCAMQSKKVKADLPRMCIQLLLPESKQQLRHLLGLYSRQGFMAPQTTSRRWQPDDAVTASHDAAATKAAPPTADRGKLHAVDWSDAAAAGRESHQGKQPCPADAAQHQAAAAAGPLWWQRFCRQVTCMCITELRFGLLAQSCMGCSGAITLVSNLVRSVDDGVLTQSEFEHIPEWAQEYLEGSSNELYEVSAFPRHLHGQTMAKVAEYLFEVHRAVLLATAGTAAAGRGSFRTTQTSSGGSAWTGTNGESKPAPMGTSTGPERNTTGSRQGVLLLSPLAFGELVAPHTAAFVIAADVRVVLDIMESTPEDFSAWAAANAKGSTPPSDNKQLAKHSMACVQPAVSCGGAAPRAAQHSAAAALLGSTHQTLVPQQQQGVAASMAARPCPAADGCYTPMLHSAVQGTRGQQPEGSSCGSRMGPPTAIVDTMGPGSTAQGLPPVAAITCAAQEDLAGPRQTQQEAAQAGPATSSSPSSRRSTTEQSSQGNSFRRAGAAALMGASARTLLAALPGPLGSPTTHDAGMHSRQRRQRGAIQITARCTAALMDCMGDETGEVGTPACQSNIGCHLLMSPGTAISHAVAHLAAEAD